MKKSIQICMMGILAFVLIMVCACSNKEQAQQEQPSSSNLQTVEVIIPLDAPEFTSECTNLPVRVVGNDANGKQVEEVCYVNAEGKGVELLPGDYSFAVIASPLAPEGKLFIIPEPGIGITIPEDAQNADIYEVPRDLAWSFSYKNADAVTKEQVDEAYEYALKSPGQAQLAETLYKGYDI